MASEIKRIRSSLSIIRAPAITLCIAEQSHHYIAFCGSRSNASLGQRLIRRIGLGNVRHVLGGHIVLGIVVGHEDQMAGGGIIPILANCIDIFLCVHLSARFVLAKREACVTVIRNLGIVQTGSDIGVDDRGEATGQLGLRYACSAT